MVDVRRKKIVGKAALDRVKKLINFSSNLFSIPFYKRYVDDSLILLNSTCDGNAILDALNNSHPIIEFELENPAADNSIAILDCKIQILDDGSLKQSFYEKQAKKPIFILSTTNISEKQLC